MTVYFLYLYKKTIFRKHLYRRYIKPHKSCWNLITNTHPYNLSHFDCDTACYVCLAFATWRLLNENLLVIEGFKNPKIRSFKIKLFELPEEGFVQSNRAYLNLLYAQFFSIWHLIVLIIHGLTLSLMYPTLQNCNVGVSY